MPYVAATKQGSEMNTATQLLEILRENFEHARDSLDEQSSAYNDCLNSIFKIEAYLAKQQVEQEPVAWYTDDHLTDRSATTYRKDMAYAWECKGWGVTPLYASPQAREPMSEDKISKLHESITHQHDLAGDEIVAFARAIEAHHGIEAKQGATK